MFLLSFLILDTKSIQCVKDSNYSLFSGLRGETANSLLESEGLFAKNVDTFLTLSLRVGLVQTIPSPVASIQMNSVCCP